MVWCFREVSPAYRRGRETHGQIGREEFQGTCLSKIRRTGSWNLGHGHQRNPVCKRLEQRHGTTSEGEGE
ncbi:hypothetical protein ATANTOWER_031054 [Ataeniobius toweri]|uniref:Uncharacterized protein n=1 Tax=Ataeniobius toweri TaxID=208326 RepID=A0ABU7A900_9TELE|nr:hypothetical protein [Ataeniobius toweri]